MIIVNLAAPKAAAKQELLFNKPATVVGTNQGRWAGRVGMPGQRYDHFNYLQHLHLHKDLQYSTISSLFLVVPLFNCQQLRKLELLFERKQFTIT
jgi:hypothetical protein